MHQRNWLLYIRLHIQDKTQIYCRSVVCFISYWAKIYDSNPRPRELEEQNTHANCDQPSAKEGRGLFLCTLQCTFFLYVGNWWLLLTISKLFLFVFFPLNSLLMSFFFQLYHIVVECQIFFTAKPISSCANDSMVEEAVWFVSNIQNNGLSNDLLVSVH